MGDATTGGGNLLDGVIKYAGPLIGIVTAALTLYVAMASRDANVSLTATRADIEKLNLASAQFDLAARVVHAFGAQNAREFAATVAQKAEPLHHVDAELERQLKDGIERWGGGRALMTGTAVEGLYLRQIVYLRIKSTGRKTAATDLRLVVRQKDFGFSQNGTQVKRYRRLDTAGWTERELRLPNLMELSPETRGMPSELFIPLAQVSGGEYYFGRVFVPVKLLWKDERLGGGDRSIEFDLAKESALDNQLDSAILGKSTGSARL